MLTEQIVVSESSTGDTLPLGFITAEDGRTLLAVAGRNLYIYIIRYFYPSY